MRCNPAKLRRATVAPYVLILPTMHNINRRERGGADMGEQHSGFHPPRNAPEYCRACRMFELDGQVYTWGEMSANEADVLNVLDMMSPGESYTFGGGAAAEQTITRVA